MRKLSKGAAIVKEHYATMLVKDIIAQYGISRQTIDYHARRMGLQRTPELIAQMELNRREYWQRVGKSTKAKMLIDKRRILGGEQPKYRYRRRELPVNAYQAKRKLIREHGYHSVDGEPRVLEYDERTRRKFPGTRENAEAYYVKKYRFEFRPTIKNTET